MKTIVILAMLFMFSQLGASSIALNNDRFSESYHNSNSKVLKSLEKFEFKVGMANSLKLINTKYKKNASILHKVVLIVNYKF